MQITQIIFLAVIAAAVALGLVLLIYGKGKRSTTARLGKDGVTLESKNEEEGVETTKISGITVTGSKRTTVETRERGAHVEGVTVKDAEDTEIKAGKGN